MEIQSYMFFPFLLVFFVMFTACSSGGGEGGETSGSSFNISSTAFSNGSVIPRKFTCKGKDVSPLLQWTGVPAEAKSLVLLMDDPDAPAGTWKHWGVYDIPVENQQLDENVPKQNQVGSLKQAVNDFRKVGYGGPCPPPGHGVHHYYFRLIAVSVESLGLNPGANYSAVKEAANRHKLSETTLMGTYSR